MSGAGLTAGVGDTLWYVPDRRRGTPREVKVLKVGRKWMTLEWCGRVDPTTGEVDGAGYSSPGRVYPDRATWEAETLREAAWRKLRQAVDHRWTPPPGVTVEAIRQAERLLGLAADAREPGGVRS